MSVLSSSSSIKIVLLMGPVVPVPVPQSLAQALSQVEITRTDQAPSGFQLTFHAEKTAGGDYSVVDSPLLLPFNRVIVIAWLGSFYKVLSDGYITSRELTPADGEAGARVTVTGEDVSVKMDMVEVSYQYPFMPKTVQVGAMLARYMPLGVVPMVVPPLGDLPDIDTTDQEVATDRAQLQFLAGLFGYRFYVMPGPVPGVNLAYWGPPSHVMPPQVPLTINLGASSNVESMTASHNALGPEFNYGTYLVEKAPVPFTAPAIPRMPPFSAEPLLLAVFTPLGLLPETLPAWLLILAVRGKYMSYSELDDYAQALAKAQSRTQLALDQTVTLKGELDTASYGSILTAPGVVSVRGMGIAFDGYYMVKEVVHSINLDYGTTKYTQKFTLTREGMGIGVTIPWPEAHGITVPLF